MINGKGFSFRKPEKLRLRSLVETLFKEGESLYAFPLRLVWKEFNATEMSALFRHGVPQGIGRVQMMVTVPKKKRKRAVDRVLLRRRIREAYRLKRDILSVGPDLNPGVETLSLAFIYIATENLPYKPVAESMSELLQKLSRKLNKKHEKGTDSAD